MGDRERHERIKVAINGAYVRKLCMQNTSLVFFIILTCMTHNGPPFTVQGTKIYKDKVQFFLPAEIRFDAQR